MITTQDATNITIAMPSYRLVITKAGFRYSFRRPDGSIIAPAHPQAGLALSAPDNSTLYNALTTTLSRADATRAFLQVITANGDTADVVIAAAEHMVRMQIVPVKPPAPTIQSPPAAPAPAALPTPATEPPDKAELEGQAQPSAAFAPTIIGGYTIDARLGGIGKGYGLGDHGSSTALEIDDDDFTNGAPNDYLRFVSNFTVFPAQGFAQVLFWNGRKRVEVNKTNSRLGIDGARQIDNLYYFIGSMPEIYAAYKAAKVAAGYPDQKPKYAMFEPGWEAFGALSWNTDQQSVTALFTEYLNRGYRFGWAVVGSRTWRGNPDPITAGTTRFGMWDDGAPGSSNPPRYPDPAAFKRFFRERNIKLVIGLRINIDKGNPYYTEAKQQGYFIADHEPLIDAHNPAALDWYIKGVNLWGVDGFKEDLCCGQNITYHDAKANPVNERLMRQGSYVIVRNTAYSVPGDLMRREDTEFNGYWGKAADLIRKAIAYAASGAPNYYPDIVGGTKLQNKAISDAIRRYLVRNATIAAAMPSMSFGFAPWLLGDVAAAQVQRAAEWHYRIAPYIYSAAIDSFNSGYPYTLTPLMIAYPNDPALYDLDPVEWMLGPSILAIGAGYQEYTTIGGDECKAMVQLPQGIWIDPDTGKQFQGPATIKDYPLPLGKIPVLIGGKGVLIERNLPKADLVARVFPIAMGGSRYSFTAPDGKTTSTITNDNDDWDPQKLRVRDLTSNAIVNYTRQATTGAIVFPLTPGHNYRLYTEHKVFIPRVSFNEADDVHTP
jgi:Glycosyl hydrolases family 31